MSGIIQGVSGGMVNILGGGSMDCYGVNKFILICVQFSMGVEIQLFGCYA